MEDIFNLKISVLYVIFGGAVKGFLPGSGSELAYAYYTKPGYPFASALSLSQDLYFIPIPDENLRERASSMSKRQELWGTTERRRETKEK